MDRMGKVKDIAYHSAIYVGGLMGSFVIPVLTGGLVGTGGILSEMLKEVFKGLTGKHFPGFQKSLHRRLHGVDASKLNHDLQHAMKRAVDQTRLSLITRYTKEKELEKWDTDERFLKALCEELKKALDENLAQVDSRHEVTAFVTGGSVEGKVDWEGHLTELMVKVGDEKDLPCSRTMRKVIDEAFHKDLHLHFMEELKDEDDGAKARVAFEQLTSSTILAELKEIKEALRGGSGVGGSAMELAKEVRRSGEERTFTYQLDGFMAKYPDGAALQKDFAPRFDTAIKEVSTQLSALRKKLDSVHEDVRHTGRNVERVGRKSSRNIAISSSILVVVLAATALVLLDPLHWRSFPVKVEVVDALSYGAPDRIASWLAIDHAGIRDTVEVVNGRASFMVPNGSRNDDAVLRLLCQQQGQTFREARVCDSAVIRLTDQDRIRFGMDEAVVKNTDAGTIPPGSDRTPVSIGGRTTPKTEVAPGGSPPCVLDGLVFRSDASLEDELTITKGGSGRATVTGEVNRKPIDGAFKVNGPTLTAIANSGSVLGGTLRLATDCGRLTGTLTVRSMTGNVVSERVDMVAGD